MGWFTSTGRSRRRGGWSALAVALLIFPSATSAEERAIGQGDEVLQEAPEDVAPAPNVGLDQLLQLPDSYSTGAASTGEVELAGASAPEWRVRFAEADEQIGTSKRELVEAQRLMETNANGSSQWNLSAPGVQADASQDSSTGLPLRQRIRRLREDVAEAERSKRALEVEADLAGVPDSWRQ
jgi:hypothetical protein